MTDPVTLAALPAERVGTGAPLDAKLALPPPAHVGVRDGITGRWLPGHPVEEHWHRPKGSAKAAALLDHSAPSLMRHSIHRATVGKRDAVLTKLLDKLLPDAGMAATGTVAVAVVFPTRAGGWSTVNPMRTVQESPPPAREDGEGSRGHGTLPTSG